MWAFGSSSNGNNKINTRTVVFIDSINNTVISTQTIEVGKNAKLPDEPTHDGCDFKGWYTDKDVKTDDFTNIRENITVYSKCEWKYFTVTFYDTISKNKIDTQEVKYGEDATAPSAPTHKDYRFTGWSREYANVKANIRVNALYSSTVEYYTVRFYDNDTKELIKTEKVKEGLSATFPTIPTHKNRVFDRYEGKYTNVTENRVVTLYFKDAEKFSVTFKGGAHGSLNNNEESVLYSVFVNNTFNEGGVVVPTVTPVDGYTFDKWDTDFNENTVVTNNITITALYTPNTNTEYTVEYYKNGTKVDSDTVTRYATTDTTAGVTDADKNKYEGYTFDSTNVNNVLNGNVNGTGSLVLKVYYKINSYNLEIKYKYLIGITAKPTHNSTVEYNADYSVTSPLIPGYTANKTVVSGTMPSKDVDVTVIYTPNRNTPYKVEFYKDNVKVDEDTRHTITDLIVGVTLFDLIKYEGYSFDSENSNNVLFGRVDGEGNLVLKVYYKINTYDLKIKYKYSNGTTAKPTYTDSLNYKASYSVTSPVIAGYTANKTVVSGTMPSRDLDVTVIYTPNRNTAYRVEYYKNNVKVDGDTVIRYATTDTKAKVTNSDKTKYTGYTFDSTNVNNVLRGNVNGDGSLVLKVYYKISNYNLKINYQYSNGAKAADEHLSNVDFGTGYSVTSPIIPGYIADKTVVSGTMPSSNIEVTVTYTANTNTAYTVEYYKGNTKVDSDTATRYATTDTTAGVTDADKNKYEGYTFDSTNVNNVLSGNVNGDESLVLRVYYKANSYNLKINYKYSNGVTAKSTYNDTVEYNTDYSVTSPIIPGYIADKTVVSGTMPSSNIEVTVTYTANTNTAYTVEYYKGNTKVDSDTATRYATTDTTAGVTDADKNKYEGYTFDSTNVNNVLSGNVNGDESLVLRVYYKANSYNLKINYKYSNGVTAKSTYNDTVEYNTDYSVTSPIIPGYIADKTVVSGTMPSSNVEVTVTYTPNPNTAYKVEYYFEDLDDDDDYSINNSATELLSGTTGTTATYTIKTFEGFTHDKTTPTNKTILADGSLVIKLYYTRNSYKLTLNNKDKINGFKVNGDNKTGKYEKNFKYGKTITVTAIIKSGHKFCRWVRVSDSEILSTNKTYTFTMPAGSLSINAYGSNGSCGSVGSYSLTGNDCDIQNFELGSSVISSMGASSTTEGPQLDDNSNDNTILNNLENAILKEDNLIDEETVE
jgi:hypothetical protein